jgi:hypothetical protein
VRVETSLASVVIFERIADDYGAVASPYRTERSHSALAAKHLLPDQ